MIRKPIVYGLLATSLLLGVYFLILTLISGWSSTLNQFLEFRYFIITLSIGFGIQVSLYTYLKKILQKKSSSGVVAFSGSTSGIAMLSCCTHYLVNILPIIGIGGLATFIGFYQTEIFWIGIIFNIIGIIYISYKIFKCRRL